MNSPNDAVLDSIAPPESAKTQQYGLWSLIGLLFVLMYWRVFKDLYANWTFFNSYYTHGFLIPLISGFFVWSKREALRNAEVRPSILGYPILILACFTLLVGDFMGFRILGQLSMIPLLAGIVMVLFGVRHAYLLWFPILFLIFMIPIPPSMIQGMVVAIKLFATDAAVGLAQLLTLPMIRSGSFVIFGNDQLLVGEVCGGLRSLIALIAFGALMSYISKTRTWARYLILAVSGPIAVIANTTRIFVLCVIGYFWGSGVATGRVHDISGILIFVVAFALLFLVESTLKKMAPAKTSGDAAI